MGDYGMGGNGEDDYGIGSDGMEGHGKQGGRNRDGNIIINNNVNSGGCGNIYDSEDMVEKLAMAVVTKIREMIREDMDMSYDKDGHHDEDEPHVEHETKPKFESKKDKKNKDKKNKG